MVVEKTTCRRFKHTIRYNDATLRESIWNRHHNHKYKKSNIAQTETSGNFVFQEGKDWGYKHTLELTWLSSNEEESIIHTSKTRWMRSYRAKTRWMRSYRARVAAKLTKKSWALPKTYPE